MLAEIVFSRLSLTGFQLAPVSYLYSSKYRSQMNKDSAVFWNGYYVYMYLEPLSLLYLCKNVCLQLLCSIS